MSEFDIIDTAKLLMLGVLTLRFLAASFVLWVNWKWGK